MRFITLTLTLGILASTPGIVASSGSDETLERVAKRSAASLQIRHNKARKALLNMSRDSMFDAYFASDDVAHRNLLTAVLGSRSRAMAKKLEAQTLTVLDADGNSIVKVVEENILDAGEAGQLQSPHAWASSLKGQRNPAASPIYLSAHLDRWVIAHARTVAYGSGKNAVLHAEFDLATLQKSIGRKSRPKRIDLMAVTQDGWVVFDSRKDIPTHRWAGSDDPADYFDQFEVAGLNLQDVIAGLAAGDPLYTGDGTHREIAVSKADGWYLVAIGTRIRLGAATE